MNAGGKKQHFLMRIGQQLGERSRASKYKPEYCDQIIVWGEMGEFVEEWAANLNVTIPTIYYWAKTHPEFEEALGIAYTKLAATYAKVGRKNLSNPNFRQGLYVELLRKRFPTLYGADPKGHIGDLDFLKTAPETLTGEADDVPPPGTEARLKDDDLKAQIEALQRRRSHDAGT